MQYVLRTTALLIYVGIYIGEKRHCYRVDVIHVPIDNARTYIEEKKLSAAIYIGEKRHCYRVDVIHVPIDNARTYIEEKNYQLL